ncbi:MAG: cell division protein SepF [Bacilli bacterium]|nr:cell division protein SepF [Bacilli bacterium]MBQ3469065.1 cell division protein SepF [Bacilli bacterium]
MALNKLKNIFGNDDNEETVVEEEFYSSTKEEFAEDNGPAGSKMMLLEPRAYSESQQIADYLKARNAVVVNLKRVTPDQAKRIVDFLSGTLYAIGGDLQKLGGGIFLCTPNNVNVEGQISDDKEPTSKAKSKAKDKEDDEFNW